MAQKMPREAVPFLLALALALVSFGCNGDEAREARSQGAYKPEHSTTVTTASIIKTKFVDRVNRICRKTWGTVIDNFHEHIQFQDRSLGPRERFADAVERSLLAGVTFYIFDNIRKIGAPPGQSKQIEDVIGPMQVAVELGWKKRWRAYSVADVVRQFATYNERARRYGLDDCLVNREHLRGIEAGNASADSK